jgi:hypothetical protein
MPFACDTIDQILLDSADWRMQFVSDHRTACLDAIRLRYERRPRHRQQPSPNIAKAKGATQRHDGWRADSAINLYNDAYLLLKDDNMGHAWLDCGAAPPRQAG